MSNEDKQKVLDLLYGVMNQVSKQKTIAEKRNFLTKFLTNNIDFLDLLEPIDPNSEEIQELIADNFLKVVEQPKCFQDEGFVPWLDNKRSNIKWKFYDRYEKYLLFKKKWDWPTVSSIKESTDIILDHTADPTSDLYFKKRGLVIGDIQSGKTANYTGLINKAIDAGYKIIIILAGLTRDLRNQTQRRIDKEVLGFETKANQKGKAIGVGTIQPCVIEGLTYADEKKDYGDFKKYFSSHTLDKDSMTPLVAIVKKQRNVLENLASFLTSSQEYCYTDKKLNAPVLIIDDEVDQASVDTNNADALTKASAINKGIRCILQSLNRYSYVGYTATPFANIFIDPDKEDDLYPRDFILCLESSPNYSGIKEYFGIDIKDASDEDEDHSEDLFVEIKDFDEMFADPKVTSTSQAVKLPGSLKEAIRSFIIGAAIKKSRNIIGHNSMLIHVARFKSPATTLKPLVTNYLKELYKNLKYETDDEVQEYYNLWNDKFKSVSFNRLGNSYQDKWNEIYPFLLPSINSAMSNVKVINGDLNEQIDYEETMEGEHIVIGGDKLSRGLTLEGLLVSYYYRKSRMYDSLLQMGRWFGYRDGWIDLCRVYTTVRVMNDFIYAGKALLAFKQDVDDMYVQKKNPREVGQKIMYSPNLIPTSYSKMRGSEKMKVSFSEEIQQVISFSRKYVNDNYKTTENFINKLGEGDVRDNNKVVFKKIPVDYVLEYLRNYKDAEEFKGQISIQNWVNYIEEVNKTGELKTWTVVLNSLKKENETNSIRVGKYTIYKPSRTLREEGDSSKFKTFLIKSNNDPTDFKEIFEPGTNNYNSVDHYNKTKEYAEFNSTTGLISIYIEDFYEKEFDHYTIKDGVQKAVFKKGKRINDAINVTGPAIWFPKTKDLSKSAVLFYVNKDFKKYIVEDATGEEFDD